MKTESKKRYKPSKTWLIVFLLVVIASVLIGIKAFASFYGIGVTSAMEKIAQQLYEPEVPKEYIPLYQKAADAYGIPWTLLAAHHRMETRFSTMDPLLSSAGAEGHLQFMPCTFVGWEHPTCSGLGKGAIKEEEKTDPAVIKEYGGYGVDGNKDGVADPYNLEDALYSAANYLAETDAAEGDLKGAISHYNQSEEYVEDVLFYYEKYEKQFKAN